MSFWACVEQSVEQTIMMKIALFTSQFSIVFDLAAVNYRWTLFRVVQSLLKSVESILKVSSDS
jgi:hypothetical protein